MNALEVVSPLGLADLRDHNGEKVLSHHVLAQRLDVEPHDLVKVMRRLAEEDPSFGALEKLGTFSELSGKTKQTKLHYLLDEHRAITVTFESRSKKRHALRAHIISVYLAVKNVQMPRNLPPILQDYYRPHEVVWQSEIAEGLCFLNGEKFTGRQPLWCKKHYSIIWECIVGKEVYRELKRLNANPHQGRNHHQLLRDEMLPKFKKQLDVVNALLKTSSSLADFIVKIRFFYQQTPFQLPLMGTPMPMAQRLS